MKSFAWRSLMVLTLAVILTGMVSDANAARRSSMAGNQFINDADDMYAFPQLMLEYKNRLIVQFAADSGYEFRDGDGMGDGSVTFGDKSVWQFNTGRSDFLSNTAHWAWGGVDRDMGFGGYMNGWPGSGAGSTVEWWDVGHAREMGGRPWGFNISWAVDKNEFNPDGGDPTVDNSTNMLSFQVGSTFGSTEVAGEIGFGSYKDKVNTLDPSDQNDFSFFNFSLLARGDVTAGGLDWRWIAAFANGSTEPKVTDAVKLGSTAFRGSFGPVWGTPGQWEAAAYMSFDYVKTEYPGAGVDLKNTGTFMGFPSYNMAMEYYLNSWFVFRGGVLSHNASDKFEWEIAGGGKDEDTERVYEFDWTAGFGVDKGNWGVDVAVDEGNFHSGYVVGNGDTSGPIFSYVTAWMAW